MQVLLYQYWLWKLSFSVSAYLSNFKGNILPLIYTHSPMGLKRVVDFQLFQFFSCLEDKSDDF